MASKKASVEVQFNWIFVMVAGALILVFFFGVVQKQRELSQAKISNSLLTNLESIATGAGVSKGTVQKVPMPNIGINFGCTEECLCSYSIENSVKDYGDKIIFAPNLVKGSEIILWTLDWKIPFRVTNFVYATTANDKYFFVYDNINSGLFRMINQSLPQEVNAEFILFSQYTQVKNENYNSAKFIFLDTTSPIPDNLGIDSSFRRADVAAVYLSSGGDVVFYNKLSARNLDFEKRTSSYFGEPLIYGAIFASNFDAYECNMISGLDRLQKILDIYIGRSQYLDEQNNEFNFCSKGYSTLNLDEMKTTSGNAMSTTSTVKSLSSPVASVKTQNEQLLRSSCPLIY